MQVFKIHLLQSLNTYKANNTPCLNVEFGHALYLNSCLELAILKTREAMLYCITGLLVLYSLDQKFISYLSHLS